MSKINLILKEFKKTKMYPYYTDDKYVYEIQAKDDTNYIALKLGTKFTVDRVVLNKESKEVSYDITVYNEFGANSVRISKAVFCKRRFIELLAYGIDYNSVFVDNLLDYVSQAVVNAPHIKEYTLIGWDIDDNNGEAFFGYDDEYVGRIKLKQKNTFADEQGYIDKLNCLIKDSLGCQLAVCLSLSSVLFSDYEELLHTGTPIFHIFGDSSMGKSTALVLAASMWGNPDLSNTLLSTWNSTDNALLSKFNNNFGVTICLDEAGLLPRKSYTSIIYSISQGLDKSRLNSANQVQPKMWKTVAISSGENSLLEASSQNSGLRVRCIEFLDLPITNSAMHSKEIKTFCLSNYGIIGKKFVEQFCNDVTPTLDSYNTFKNKLDNLIETERGTDERLITVFAVVLDTAKRLSEFLSIDIDKLTDFFVDYIKEITDKALPLSVRAYNTILEWVSNNTAFINCYYDVTEKLYGAVGEKYGNTIIIKETNFEKLLFDAGFSDVTVVAKALKKAGLLKADGNGLKYRYTFEGNRVNCYCVLLNK